MNVELLKRIQEVIREEPRRLDMGSWGNSSNRVPCGTVACIAGWAIALESGERGPQLENSLVDMIFVGGVEVEAARILDLTPKQSGQLFFDAAWPEQFDINAHSPQTPEYADVACRRIDHFIQTGGEQ